MFKNTIYDIITTIITIDNVYKATPYQEALYSVPKSEYYIQNGYFDPKFKKQAKKSNFQDHTN